MGSKTDEAKGRVNEALGDLKDDPTLKREGKLDRASAEAKRKVGKTKDRADDVIDDGKRKLDELLEGDAKG
jgi:uncharacterized protein YjbJ (UPF0337 family)